MAIIVNAQNYKAVLKNFRMYRILAQDKNGNDRMITGITSNMNDLLEAEKQHDGFEMEKIHFSKSYEFDMFDSVETEIFQNDQDIRWKIEIMNVFDAPIAVIHEWIVQGVSGTFEKKRTPASRSFFYLNDLDEFFQGINKRFRSVCQVTA